MIFFRIVIFLIFNFVSAYSTAVNFAKFPGDVTSINSPDNNFSIHSEDYDEEPNHSLFFKYEQTGIEKKILDFRRHADISWAPDSKYFFVNDYLGSDFTNCIVIALPELKKINIMPILKTLPIEEGIFDSHHLHVTCEAWRNDGYINVRLTGYGDQNPSGFDYGYLVDFNRGLIISHYRR